MADILNRVQNLLGGAVASASSALSPDDGAFADFATAASPAVPSHAASSSFPAPASTAPATGFNRPFAGLQGRPYTKWYRVWERVTIADFYQELAILPLLVVIIIVSIWGSRANRQRAKRWAASHRPLLQAEFASVGFGPASRFVDADSVQSQGLLKASEKSGDVPADFLKEKSKNEFITYCTGRQNVAWLDIRLTLHKRYNPLLWFGETALSFFLDSVPAPVESLEATAYAFDGREKTLLPSLAQGSIKDSTYDNFVWAVVHKDKMKRLRDERYDLSLTSTKDHPKLPTWATVMSESAEITEAMLTPELIKAIHDAGEGLEALIVSDQPVDAPRKLDDTLPRKRFYLLMHLGDNVKDSSLFAYFLRMPDQLVANGRFRPEALRKIKGTREQEIRKIRKVDEEEKAEERRLAGDKLKKEERDRKLSKMSADDQKKFLEKEKEKEQRRAAKKQSMRG